MPIGSQLTLARIVREARRDGRFASVDVLGVTCQSRHAVCAEDLRQAHRHATSRVSGRAVVVLLWRARDISGLIDIMSSCEPSVTSRTSIYPWITIAPDVLPHRGRSIGSTAHYTRCDMSSKG